MTDACFQWTNRVLDLLKQKMPLSVEKAGQLDFIPYTVQSDASWAPGPMDGICWWTNGFWPALMWQMLTLTGDERYVREARRTERMLDAAFDVFPLLHHDVGFMWRISTGFDHDLTGDETARITTEKAATILAGRFNPAGFIRAWNGDRVGWAIIDCMMNLSILYWASEHTGDPRFASVAQRHADTVQDVFIRPDGSSEHIVIFDPLTCDVLERPGGQGYAPGSAWSRGQAWAIYGFAISAAHTGREDYLATACRVADFFVRETDRSDGLVPCDFRQPQVPVLYDDCAAAVAACGLLELAEQLRDPKGDAYAAAAFRILSTVEKAHADWSEDFPAILTHCTGAYHSKDHHIAMVYADYFFVEAVLRLAGKLHLRW